MTHPVVLVVACDGSPVALHAADFIASYRGDAARLKLHAVNVQHRPLTLFPGAGIDPAALHAALQEAGREALAPALERLSQAGFASEGVVREGFAAAALLEEAQNCDAQALVVGTRGSGALRGFAFGSVAMRVIHASVLPTFIVGPEARLPAQLGKTLRVLLATDGSEQATRAMAQVIDWRDWLGDLDVHLVHVQPPLTLLDAILPPHRDLLNQWNGSEAEKATQPVRDLLVRAGVKYQPHLAAGDPASEITRVATEKACELTVLGTRGRGAAHHALIGSVALKAVALSAVPALLVP